MPFFKPTMDPCYQGFIPHANGTLDYIIPHHWNKTIHRPDEAASPLGCIKQYQYYNAERKCGELASFYDSITTAATFLNASIEEIYSYANVSDQTSS